MVTIDWSTSRFPDDTSGSSGALVPAASIPIACVSVNIGLGRPCENIG